MTSRVWINGDGRDEIIRMEADGTVRAYKNALAWNPLTYYDEHLVIGEHWSDPSRLMFA